MAAYHLEVLADNPALYWRFAELAGTTAEDETANNRDGTYGAGVTLGQSSLLASEPGNPAVTLSGTSTGRITSTYSPFVAGSTRTFEGLARRTNSAGTDALMGSDTATAGNQVIVLVEAGAPALFKFAANTSGGEASWPLAWSGDNQNLLWDVVYNDSTKKATLWINGESKGEKTLPSGYGTPGNLVVGAWANTFLNPWHGKQDEIAVYTAGLSEARIKAHSEAAFAAATFPPVFPLRPSRGLVLR